MTAWSSARIARVAADLEIEGLNLRPVTLYRAIEIVHKCGELPKLIAEAETRAYAEGRRDQAEDDQLHIEQLRKSVEELDPNCICCNGSGTVEVDDNTRGDQGGRYEINCCECGGTGEKPHSLTIWRPKMKTNDQIGDTEALQHGKHDGPADSPAFKHFSAITNAHAAEIRTEMGDPILKAAQQIAWDELTDRQREVYMDYARRTA